LRIKEQETRLNLHEHDDDDDDEKPCIMTDVAKPADSNITQREAEGEKYNEF